MTTNSEILTTGLGSYPDSVDVRRVSLISVDDPKLALPAGCSVCCIAPSRIPLSVMLPTRYPALESDHVHHALTGNATGASGIWEDPRRRSTLFRFIGHSHPLDLFASCSNKQRSIHKLGGWFKLQGGLIFLGMYDVGRRRPFNFV